MSCREDSVWARRPAWKDGQAAALGDKAPRGACGWIHSQRWCQGTDVPWCRYGGEHRAPELQKEAVYGLTELHREEVKKARLVANPGCYPTSVQLPLCPLLEVSRPPAKSPVRVINGWLVADSESRTTSA